MLAETPFAVELEKKVALTVTANGSRITAIADGVSLEANDKSSMSFTDGGIGLLVYEGALSTDSIRIASIS